MCRSLSLLFLTVCALACDAAAGGGLYSCNQNGVVTYAQQPCANGDAAAITIDRAAPREAMAGENPPRAFASSAHRLSQAERERLAQLRRDEATLNDEALIAAELEIAAIREGADAQLSVKDRGALESLRVQLGSSDHDVRAQALAQWRLLYARYRIPAHPRFQPAAPGLASAPARPGPEPPLGAVVPGTRGPLVSPAEPPAVTLPSRVPPVADPVTGRILTPAGSDRMIDPITGTLWTRSGRVYVDPLSGRIIPAP